MSNVCNQAGVQVQVKMSERAQQLERRRVEEQRAMQNPVWLYTYWEHREAVRLGNAMNNAWRKRDCDRIEHVKEKMARYPPIGSDLVPTGHLHVHLFIALEALALIYEYKAFRGVCRHLET